jgi:5'-deoxynucleotidase YfbR-like HD superfamily hydrolase
MIDNCILTASGRYFNLREPERNEYSIGDIATALSRICRFVGHTKAFYSVAQHSVYVSRLLPDKLALQGLMHDASEAYLGDVSYPLKGLLPEYRTLEKALEATIARVFGLPYPFDPAVKRADMVMLATERRDLMPEQDEPWPILSGVILSAETIVPVSPDAARALFMQRIYELWGLARGNKS